MSARPRLSQAVFIIAGLAGGSSGQASDREGDAIGITDAILTSRSANCADYANTFSPEATAVRRAVTAEANLTVSTNGTTCTFASNTIPNHDFNATGRIATPTSTQTQSYTVTATPIRVAHCTARCLTYDSAVFLNGVMLDQLAAGCYGVGDGNIGCFEMSTPYRYDPLVS